MTVEGVRNFTVIGRLEREGKKERTEHEKNKAALLLSSIKYSKAGVFRISHRQFTIWRATLLIRARFLPNKSRRR